VVIEVLEFDIGTYCSVINACSYSGDKDRAAEWSLKSQDAGLELDIITYNSAINAFANSANKDLEAKWLSIAYRSIIIFFFLVRRRGPGSRVVIEGTRCCAKA